MGQFKRADEVRGRYRHQAPDRAAGRLVVRVPDLQVLYVGAQQRGLLRLLLLEVDYSCLEGVHLADEPRQLLMSAGQ